MSNTATSKLKTFLTSRNAEWLFFIVIGLILACLTSRGITTGDNPEFIAAAATGGVVHAPGYPLYTLLTHILAGFPLGEIAWKVNLFSALTSTLTIATVYYTIKRITENKLASLLGASLLLANEAFLIYSFSAEVHSLQILLLASYVLFAILFWQTDNKRWLYLASLMISFGVAHNQSIIFTLPSFLILLYLKHKQLTLVDYGKTAIIAFSGLLIYGYVLYAASQKTVMNWGGISGFASFLSFILRQDFGTLTLNTAETNVPVQFLSLPYYLKTLFTNAWFLIPFAGYASYVLYQKQKYLLFLMTSLFLFLGPLLYIMMNTPVLTIMHRANVEQYYGYSHFLIIILAGVGIAFLMKRFTKHAQLMFWTMLTLIIVLSTIMLQQTRQDTKNLVSRTVATQLASLPRDAVMITCADSFQMPGYYEQFARNERTDVTILNICLVSAPWYRENLADTKPRISPYVKSNGLEFEKLCREVASRGKLYLYPWFPEFTSSFPGCTVIPDGLVNKVVPTDAVPELSQVKEKNDTIWRSFTQSNNLASLKGTDIRSRESLYYLADQKNMLGLYYLTNGKTDWALKEFISSRNISEDSGYSIANEAAIYMQSGRMQEALDIVKLGLERDPGNASLYKAAGVLYLQTNNAREASYHLQTYLDFNPKDPDVPKIEAMLQQLKQNTQSY